MMATPKPPFDETAEHGISLRSLTEAFAQALGRTERDAEPVEPEAVVDESAAEKEAASEEPWTESSAEVELDDACPICPRTILEAMLFVDNSENRPLTPARAAELMRGVNTSEIHDLVRELNDRYRANGCPYRVLGEGAGYRMVLRPEHHPLRNRFYGRVREARLSQAAIDVLAIVAYRQPLSVEDVNLLRDKPSGHLLAQLVRRRLLEIERPEDQPRKAVYRTTRRFLEFFGLKSLADLPQSEELERR